MDKSKKIKQKILKLVELYYFEEFIKNEVKDDQKVLFSGRVFDHEEIAKLIDSSLDFWLTAGKYSNQFEKEFSEFTDNKYTLLVNSGSSVNLVAFSTLTSPQLGDRRIKKGDEVITVAAGFPTTVAPIIQNGCIPVLLTLKWGPIILILLY